MSNLDDPTVEQARINSIVADGLRWKDTHKDALAGLPGHDGGHRYGKRPIRERRGLVCRARHFPHSLRCRAPILFVHDRSTRLHRGRTVAKVVGSVDDRQRPVVRVSFGDTELLLVVDTGFNGDVLLSATAAAEIGLAVGGDTTTVELGDGTVASIVETMHSVVWLGRSRRIRALISVAWRPVGDSPVGLIGTNLLDPHLLFIDFDARTVEIETQ